MTQSKQHIQVLRRDLPGALRTLAKAECLQFLQQVSVEVQEMLDEIDELEKQVSDLKAQMLRFESL